MRLRKLWMGILFVTVIMASLSACQPTPKEEVIKQKGNLDKVIQNGETNTSKVKISKVVKAPKKSDFEMKSENNLVDIKVHANLIIPYVTKVPVNKVIRKDFKESDIEKFRKVFFQDAELYPEVDYKNMTKNELLAKISQLQAEADKSKDEESGIDQKLNSYIEMLQSYVDSAPETVERQPLKEYKLKEDSDNKIGKTYTFYAQGKVGDITGHLSLQNGAGFSEVSFNKDRLGTSGYITATDIGLQMGKEAAELNNNCKYSEEEAAGLCKDVLNQLGIDKDYAVFSIEGIADKDSSNENVKNYNGYLIKISRVVQDVQETYDFYDGNLTEDGGQSALPYCFEKMYFVVRDDGIDEFHWNSPMVLGKQQADHVKLADYSQIEETFKNQILLNYSYADEPINIKVDEIRFGYMRVKEKDKDNEFTLIPVWDYIGNLNERLSIMTVNAIDGSIMNRQCGF